MAKAKSSSAQKGVMIPAELYTLMMELSEAKKVGDAERIASTAKMDAARQYRENIIGRMTNGDLMAIERRLSDVLMSCASIHQLAADALCGHGVDGTDHYLKAIEEMARANVKGLDACIEKIAGGPHSGLFARELEAVEAD